LIPPKGTVGNLIGQRRGPVQFQNLFAELGEQGSAKSLPVA